MRAPPPSEHPRPACTWPAPRMRACRGSPASRRCPCRPWPQGPRRSWRRVHPSRAAPRVRTSSSSRRIPAGRSLNQPKPTIARARRSTWRGPQAASRSGSWTPSPACSQAMPLAARGRPRSRPPGTSTRPSRSSSAPRAAGLWPTSTPWPPISSGPPSSAAPTSPCTAPTTSRPSSRAPAPFLPAGGRTPSSPSSTPTPASPSAAASPPPRSPCPPARTSPSGWRSSCPPAPPRAPTPAP
jgi:hypothetical protein